VATSIYLASLEARAGRSLVTLGLVELLRRQLDDVGYFRPVVRPSRQLDPRIELIVTRYGIDRDPTELWAYSSDEIAHLLADGRTEEVFKTILERYKRVEDDHPFVVIDGTDYTGTAPALEFEFNAKVANHLGAPVLAVVNGSGRSGHDVVEALRIARESLLSLGCTLAATIVNRVSPEDLEEVRKRADDLGHDEPVWCIPEEPLLSMPTVGEVVDALRVEDTRMDEADLQREITEIKVAAMTLPNVLSHISEGELMITPGDRNDVVLGALVSRLASTYPTLAALVLTGGIDLDPRIVRLLDGLASTPVPLIAVDSDTYETAQQVAAVPATIRADTERKIDVALRMFEEHVDAAALAERIQLARSDKVTPLMFEYELVQRARAERKHIVLPEGTDERILRATEILRRRNVVDLTLLGEVDRVRAVAQRIGVDLGDTPIVDPATSDLREGFAERYHELREHKGISLPFADETMHDVSYFGTMMVHERLADGMVSGAAHTTQHTIRPSFEIIRTRPGVSVVSSVFLMLMPDRVLVYGDCAVNPEPDAEQLADIAISSATTAEQFGVEPRVAMLSYSTGESGKGRAVERVREATALVRERRPDLQVEGPIQYDAAVDTAVGEAKLPGSAVAGRATVFIFPDLNTGNNTYKAVQRSSGATAVGPVLQGLNKPVNDLSRGCTVDDIVNTVTITAVQAQDDAPDETGTEDDADGDDAGTTGTDGDDADTTGTDGDDADTTGTDGDA
jgi:phosphate acetyltransferase